MNSKSTFVIAGVVVAAAAFYGGMLYGQHSASSVPNLQNLSADQRQQFLQQLRGAGGNGGAGGTMRRSGMNGNFVTGEVISKDDKSITVKMRDGGSKIVFYSGTTQVGKTVAGSSADLAIGQQVNASGTANSDGTVTADMIQIRPASPAGAPSQEQNPGR